MRAMSMNYDERFLDVAPALRGDLLHRRYGEEAVAWSPSAASPIYLDPVASLVAQFLDGTVTVGELVDDVHAVFGLPRAIAENQLRRVVSLLDGGRALTGSESSLDSAANNCDYFPGPPNP